MSCLGVFYGQSWSPESEKMASKTTPPVVDQLSKPGKLRRPPNSELRPREHLLEKEVDRLLQAAKKSHRHPTRNYTLILMMFRHGLRVSEAIALRWNQVDLLEGYLHVRRLKRGKPATHPIPGVEQLALSQLKREYPDTPFLFVSDRGGGSPLTDHAVRKLIERLGEKAGFDFPVHPHQLRHACGYYLADQGFDIRRIQDYLGHRNIYHTVRYTELAPGPFKEFWKD